MDGEVRMVWILPVLNEVVNCPFVVFFAGQRAVWLWCKEWESWLRAGYYGRTLSRTGIVGILDNFCAEWELES